MPKFEKIDKVNEQRHLLNRVISQVNALPSKWQLLGRIGVCIQISLFTHLMALNLYYFNQNISRNLDIT